MKIDDFASVFRSAVKPTFTYKPLDLQTAVFVTDLDSEGAHALATQVRALLSHLDAGEHLGLHTLSAPEDWQDLPGLLELLEERKPQLIITHRHLLGQHKDLPHTLGSVVDTLTQHLEAPVLLLPLGVPLREADRVMVVTDHLTGDDPLVNWAIHLTPDDGTLMLCHIEDQDTFERYAEVLGRMTGVPTDEVVPRMREKLLGMPRDYILAVQREMKEQGIHETVLPLVQLGQPLALYQELVQQHDARLLVVNTKDPHQRAMESLSYALAVELRSLPLLLL